MIAASAGAVAILLTAFQFTAGAAVIIGGAVFSIGLALLGMRGEVMNLLSQTLIIIGALTGAGRLLILDDGSPRAALFVTAVRAGTAILGAKALSVLAAGVILIAIAMGLRAFNRQLTTA
ncbi:hypothetical protein [Pseudorhodoplanes sp.]|uniref:hypothetical protein n=1 Tax=Pseudorhodoplanes sp. TaxID=1934341 RepID=UPI00391AAE2E